MFLLTVMPPEPRARLLLDDEAGDALGRAGGEGDEPGALAVGDPHLGAVDDVLVAVGRRPGTRCALVSLPASGSDSESAPRSSPVASAGSHRCLLLVGAVRA